MSLIFVKNKDNSVESDKYSGLLPYRFSNFFTQPIKIPSNAQIAYVSSTFSIDNAGYLQGDPFYALIGDPLYNATIPLYYPNSNIQDWDEGVNLIGALVNQYGTDNNYNDLFFTKEEVFGVEQLNFDSGNNFYFTDEGKVKIRTPQRLVNDTFNQLFNCCGANPELSYTGGSQNVPAGINLSDNAFINDVEFKAFNPTNNPNRITQTTADCFSQLPNSDAVLPITSDADFYNTQYGFYKISDDTYDWANNSGATYKVWEQLPFDGGFYPMVINNTSIKQNVNFPSSVVDGVPTDNGGGHATISKLNKFSGGYGIHSFRNVSQQLARNHYDDAFMNLSGISGRTTGFTGISPQFFGVIPTEFVYGNLSRLSEEENAQRFLDEVDLNNAINGVNDEFSVIDPMNPFGNYARYMYGVRIYEVAGTLLAQAQILDPNASLIDSDYIDVGFPLDIYKLSKGIIPNIQNGGDYTFQENADFRINIHNRDTSATSASLFFRFRWTTPYCMNIEYCLSVEGDEQSYNVLTDAPYDFATSDGITGTNNEINRTETILLNNTTGLSDRVLSFPVGNVDTNNLPVSVIQFRDSGGTGGDYRPNERYLYTFDAGVGNTINLEIVDFEFEHSGFAMYDRLSIRVSNDGITYNNIRVPWFNTSANSVFPYSTSFGAGGQTDSYGGYIFPEDPTTAQTLWVNNPSTTGNLTFPANISTGFRFVKFGFTSDGSAQRRGWDINVSTAQPNTITTSNYTANPTREWVCLFSMESYNRSVNPSQDKYLIPSYVGDLAMVQYPTTEEHSVGRKGYFDIRKSYRYNNRIQEGQRNANLFKPLIDLPFFQGDYLTDSNILVISNTAGSTTPKLLKNGVLQQPETFTSDGYSTKEIKFLLNTIEDANNLELFKKVNSSPYFPSTGLPRNLELGRMLGLVSNDITGNGSVVELDEDINDTGTDFIIYGFNGLNFITNGDLAFSNHIQITNLPIQSQNGVKSTMNKTIYIVNSLNLTNSIDFGSSTKFTDTAPVLLWIDLNNYGEINLNKLDVLITNDDNVEQKLLRGLTDMTFMIRKKPKDEEGYIPNNIPVRGGLGM
jgi:hypothetical protein